MWGSINVHAREEMNYEILHNRARLALNALHLKRSTTHNCWAMSEETLQGLFWLVNLQEVLISKMYV